MFNNRLSLLSTFKNRTGEQSFTIKIAFTENNLYVECRYTKIITLYYKLKLL